MFTINVTINETIHLFYLCLRFWLEWKRTSEPDNKLLFTKNMNPPLLMVY